MDKKDEEVSKTRVAADYDSYMRKICIKATFQE